MASPATIRAIFPTPEPSSPAVAPEAVAESDPPPPEANRAVVSPRTTYTAALAAALIRSEVSSDPRNSSVICHRPSARKPTAPTHSMT